MDILTFDIFNGLNRIKHGFSTRFHGNPGTDRVEWIDSLVSDSGSDRWGYAIPEQTHSSNVRIADAAGSYDNTDALITQVPGLILVISVADCVPVFIVDPVTNSVALVHAGWRGTKGNILARTVSTLKDTLNSDPSRLLCALGPAIDECCYTVGEDVADFFPLTAKKNNNTMWTINLKRENTNQLIASGVQKSHIQISEWCTSCHHERFYSYRREGKAAGRMIGILGIKSNGG